MTLFAVVIAVVLAAANSAHLPVTTNLAPAQSAMDHGLFLYYAYDGAAAARSFGEAAALDPGLAMAYWGIAVAAGPDLNTPLTAPQFEIAQRAIRRAASLAPGASARERSFIEIMARRYAGTFADWAADDAGYRLAMTAFAKHSNDEDARLLAAEALLEHGGLDWQNDRPASNETQTALELDASVLRDDPTNVMANHLCIHLYDLAPNRRPAEPCARRLDDAEFPPQAEHLAHMPAHYWIETGNYTAALSSSERAYALLVQLESTPGGKEHANRYLKHDVAVGYSAAMMLGNYAVARTWATRIARVNDISFAALTALRFGRYADAYAAPDPQFGNPAVKGLAALHLGHTDEARAIAARLTREGPGRGYLPQLFLARVAESDGRYADARRWLSQAAGDQHTEFAAENIPLVPADEVLGFFELRRAATTESIAAFTRALATYPNDPRALYGLAAAFAADGQTVHATQTRAAFETQWEGADTRVSGADLP